MANYYIDVTNGTDGDVGTIHDGLREPVSTTYTAAAGTDATHIHFAQGGFDNDADDNYNGDYLFNVTRALGAVISDYDADDGGGSSVISVAIANQAAGDTFYIIRAWKTLNHYTSVASDTRGAGDIAYVRANQTHTIAANIVIDESGTASSPIKVIGCDAVTNDPWGDASNTKPIIDFNAGDFYMYLNGRRFWWFERLVFKNAARTSTGTAIVQVTGASHGCRFIDCDIQESANASCYGVNIGSNTYTYFHGCTFSLNRARSISMGSAASLILDQCTFNGGGGVSTDYGLFGTAGGVVIINDCNFGQTTTHDTGDVLCEGGTVYIRNSAFATIVTPASGSSVYYFEDCATVPAGFPSDGRVTPFWKITKETVKVRAGGGAVSAKIEPINAYGGLYAPCRLGTLYDSPGFPSTLVMWGEDETTYTVTMYAAVISAWDTPLTSADCWLEASYLDHDANKTRTVVKSNDTISNVAETYTAFDVTFTCKQDGPVYLDFVLAKYEDATEGIYVDLTPVVT